MSPFKTKAEDLFKSYPSVDVFYFTPDGQAFYSADLAANHQKPVTMIQRSGAVAELGEDLQPAPHSAAPELEAAPEVDEAQEPEAAPEGEAAPEPEAAPEVEAAPELEAAPEVDEAPEPEAAPEVEAAPELKAAPAKKSAKKK